MFDLREFLVRGLLSACGKMAVHQIVLNAAGWFDKGVLTEEDMQKIEAACFGGEEETDGGTGVDN